MEIAVTWSLLTVVLIFVQLLLEWVGHIIREENWPIRFVRLVERCAVIVKRTPEQAKDFIRMWGGVRLGGIGLVMVFACALVAFAKELGSQRKQARLISDIGGLSQDLAKARAEIAMQSEKIGGLSTNLDNSRRENFRLTERLISAVGTNPAIDAAVRIAVLQEGPRVTEILNREVRDLDGLVTESDNKVALISAMDQAKRKQTEDDQRRAEQTIIETNRPVWNYTKEALRAYLDDYRKRTGEQLFSTLSEVPAMIPSNYTLGSIWVGTNAALNFECWIDRPPQTLRPQGPTADLKVRARGKKGARTMLVTVRGEVVETYLYLPSLPSGYCVIAPITNCHAEIDRAVGTLIGQQVKELRE